MKKLLRNLLTLTLAFCILFSFTGCAADFDKVGYVKSMLDCAYKGDVTRYATLTESTKEEALESYNDAMESYIDFFLYYYGVDSASIDDDAYDRMDQLTRKLLGNAKYELTEVDKKEGTIDVVVYPINVLVDTDADVDNYITAFDERDNNGEFDSYDNEDYCSEYINGIMDLLDTYMENITYADPVTITVHVYQDTDKLYTFSDEELYAIDEQIINLDF